MSNPSGIKIAGETNKGMYRSRNEDSFCFFASEQSRESLAVVADGVGGNSNGALASYICCRDLLGDFCRWSHQGAPDEFLRQAIQRVNRKLFERNFAERAPRPMATTVVAVIFTPDRIHVVHAGDSRLYEYDPVRGFVQLTTDHSFSADFARKHGFLPPGAERTSHLISRAVGARENVELDVATMKRHHLSRYLLCSDGVSGALDDDKLCRIMINAASPRSAVGQILRHSLIGNAMDNITAVAIFPDGPGDGK